MLKVSLCFVVGCLLGTLGVILDGLAVRGGWCFATAPPLAKKLGEWALSATEGGVGVLGSSLLVAAATHVSEDLRFIVLIGVSRGPLLAPVLFVELDAH